MAIRKCGNCKNRYYSDVNGAFEDCYNYKKTETEDDEILQAADCIRYEKGTPECIMCDHCKERR